MAFEGILSLLRFLSERVLESISAELISPLRLFTIVRQPRLPVFEVSLVDYGDELHLSLGYFDSALLVR